MPVATRPRRRGRRRDPVPAPLAPTCEAAPVVVRRRPLPRATGIAGLGAVLVCAGIAGAAPALAVDDPTRPDARVTHGPSCRPGGVVVEVTGGTLPYAVTLVTVRRPAGEDSAEVDAGAVVVLSTGDVDWGETIDPALEYTALDGSGTSYVDELDGYSFARPAREDCAAIAPSTTRGDAPVAGAPPVVGGPGSDVAPMPVPVLPGSGSGTAVGTRNGSAPAPVPAAEAAPLAVPGDGVSWPLLTAGFALLGAGTGLAVAWGRRERRSAGATPPGSG